MHWFLKFIIGMKFYMFRTVPLSIIRNFSLYTQQWYMSYMFANCQQTCVPSWSCLQTVSKLVWHIPLLCVQWKTPNDGQRNCPKHVEFRSKNKFEKSVHLVLFTIRNLTRCTVTWSSNKRWDLVLLRNLFYLHFLKIFYIVIADCGHIIAWNIL
jgi:hypothetical protein